MITLIPLPEAVKARMDVAMVPGAMSMPWLASFDWAAFAAFLAALYGILRLLEWGISRAIRFVSWLKSRRSPPTPPQRADE